MSGEWLADALCAQVGGELWFPEDGARYEARAAKEICEVCPVLAECREWVLSGPDSGHGVVGGLTGLERRRLRRERRDAA